ncbi:MAG: methanogenesis marker 6 protein [Candidatus Helarchaeota archaeon]
MNDQDETEARIYILSPHSRLTPAELLSFVINLRMPVKIKETCFGLIVEGKISMISEITHKVRSLDKNNIFTRKRGFPPGDPRICRATTCGGPRYGFHFLEFEHSLLPYISKALESIEKAEVIEIKETKQPKPLKAEQIKNIIEEIIPKKQRGN